jgi:hypothetical protein
MVDQSDWLPMQMAMRGRDDFAVMKLSIHVLKWSRLEMVGINQMIAAGRLSPITSLLDLSPSGNDIWQNPAS